jgi:hypothetical protein
MKLAVMVSRWLHVAALCIAAHRYVGEINVDYVEVMGGVLVIRSYDIAENASGTQSPITLLVVCTGLYWAAPSFLT